LNDKRLTQSDNHSPNLPTPHRHSIDIPITKKTPIENDYTIENIQLGSGISSVVKLCICKKKNIDYAVKVISRKRLGMDETKLRG
jgi:hypothetical protein